MTKSFNNNKPWFSPELKIKLQEKEIAFQSGDKSNYTRTMYEWRRCVNLAKSEYKSRLEKQFIAGDTRSLAGSPDNHRVQKEANFNT